MYGADMGELEVKIEDGSTLFTMSGDQGNSWINKKIEVSNNCNPYRVCVILISLLITNLYRIMKLLVIKSLFIFGTH